MKLAIFILFISKLALANFSFTQKCELVMGQGEFQDFTVHYNFVNSKSINVSHIDVNYSKHSGRIYDKEKLSSVKMVKSLESLDTPTMIISIDDVGDWGAGEINIGTDDSHEVSALVVFSSDSGGNRGIYQCERFSRYLLTELYN